MLPISELVAVARTVDEEGSSDLALALGSAWGCAGVRFVRSSANHVFRCGDSLVLRFHPDDGTTTERSGRAATLSRALAAAGAPVASAVPALDGQLVVRDRASGYAAHAVEAVHGRQLDGGEVTRGQARAWGRALGRLHEAGSELGDANGAPSWIDRVEVASEAIAEELRALPVDPAVTGIVHGDPELDNVLWTSDDEPVFVDPDDAARSWFAADISFALRDYAEPGRASDPASEPVASFLAGYREVRPLGDDELSWLPLFAKAHAAITLAGLERNLDEPEAPDWPPWAHALRERIERVAASLRHALGQDGRG